MKDDCKNQHKGVNNDICRSFNLKNLCFAIVYHEANCTKSDN